MKRLRDVQIWMHGVITHPQGIEKGAAETKIKNSVWSVDEIVTPSDTLTSNERLVIYQNSYFIRLLECFKSEYKGLLNALGNDLFQHLALSFLQEHPSTTYTLNELGKLFPHFLEVSMQENLESGEADWWQVFILDMARYERMFTEVYNGKGHEENMSVSIKNANQMKLSPSLRLLHLSYPIAGCIGDFRGESRDEFPSKQISHYVFVRINYRVHVYIVDPNEYSILNKIKKDSSDGIPMDYAFSWASKGICF